MRINLLKKVVVGGLITTLCLCCCFLNFNKNVNASKLNNDLYNIVYDSDFTSLFNFENYRHIEEINDLKGTMWVCNYDSSYPILGDDFNTYTINYISPYDAVEENNYLLAPFILQNPFYTLTNSPLNLYSYNTQCYSLKSSKVIEFVENFPNSDNLFNFISIDYTSTIKDANSYIFDNTCYTDYDVIVAYNGSDEIVYLPGIADIALSHFFKSTNPDYTYWNTLPYLSMSSPFIICFPNSNYTLEFSSNIDNYPESEFLEMFKTHFTLIEVENFSIWKNEILEDIAFDRGYNDGYEMGYNQGVYDASDTSYRFPFLTGVLNAVSDVLALEIFPNVRLGYFVLIPLVLGVTGMIFWFWRKD